MGARAVLAFDPHSLVRQGEAMQNGLTRTATLALARPVEAASRALWLEQATGAALATLHIGDGERHPAVVPCRPTRADGAAASPEPRPSGRERIVRAPDGVHLSQAGSQLTAEVVLAALRRDDCVP